MQFRIEGTTLVKYDFDHQEEIVVIPEGVEVIGKYAFYVRDKVKQIIIPPTVREIGVCAFMESGVETIVIPDTVTKLGNEAFSRCTDLKKAVIGSGVTEIGDFTFRLCDSLEHLELPEGLKKVGFNAFEECYSLKTVWVGGTEYRIWDRKAPESVRLVKESMAATERRLEKYYESGSMDEFEYIDYRISGG
jgi:hypothetical protein